MCYLSQNARMKFRTSTLCNYMPYKSTTKPRSNKSSIQLTVENLNYGKEDLQAVACAVSCNAMRIYDQMHMLQLILQSNGSHLQ